MAFLATFTSEFFMTTAWRWVINTLFGFVASYGWRIILFTVCLKLLLSPLDFFNRKKSKDTQRATRRIKPQMDQLEKKYASDPRELMMQKRALQKKNHIGGMGFTCLTSILTLFIFMTLWSGMNSIAKDMNVSAYRELEKTFESSYALYMNPENSDYSIASRNKDYWVHYVNDEYGKSAEGTQAIKNYQADYKEKNGEDPSDEETNAERERLANEKFFSDNRFRYDATLTDADYYATYLFSLDGDGNSVVTEAPGNWNAAAQQFTRGHEIYRQAYWISRFSAREAVLVRYDDEVKESFLWVKNVWRADTWQSPIMSAKEYSSLTGTSISQQKYDEVMSGITQKYGTQWNGYLILVILTVVLNFLTQFLMFRIQKKSGDATSSNGTMKVMMWVMPIILAFFAFGYASAFTLYMVTNSLMTLFLMGMSTLILNVRDKRLDKKEAAGYVVSSSSAPGATRSVRSVKMAAPKKNGKVGKNGKTKR